MNGRTFFDDPQVLVLALHDLLQLGEVLAQVVDLAVVELKRVRRRLFDVETRAHVDDHCRGRGEVAGHVERLGEGDEDRGA